MSSPPEDFPLVWERDAPRLLIYARRHVGAADAPDIVADTFAIAWRRWADVPTPATPWLFATARHTIQNHLRGQRRRIALQHRIMLLGDVAETHESPHERGEALTRLAALPGDQREALLLVSWDGLTYEEAAHALGVSPSAVRKRIQRARAALDTSTTRRALVRPDLQESR